MQYLVDMRLADSGRSMTPGEGLVFIEHYILPSLDYCRRLEREKRILAGGPISAAIGFAFIISADSARDIDEIVENIPVWPRMNTTVTPLTSFSDRADAVTPRLQRLREGLLPGTVTPAAPAVT